MTGPVKGMIDLMYGRSQDARVPGKWVRRFPILAALKSLANGVNPKHGTKTVVVSKSTGNIMWLEDRAGNIIRLEDSRRKRIER